MNPHFYAEVLFQRLVEVLEDDAREALKACISICRANGAPIFLVGGSVRDLILDRPGFDLDLVIEKDVDWLGNLLADSLPGRFVTHERFGTGRFEGPGFRLDLARARRETYPHPGALPQVEPATISEDLFRRDFTMNAIALQLGPEPVLIDPFRGAEDVRSSLVRVLHDRSFQDDATRMLRAVRYTVRLDFKIASQTESLVRRDLDYLGTISGARLRREMALLFGEGTAVEGALLAQRLGVLKAIHRSLSLDREVAARWRDALSGGAYASLEELGFCILIDPHDTETVRAVSQWLHLAGKVEHALSGLVRLRAQSPKLAETRTPSLAVEILETAPEAAVWALAILQGGRTQQTCLEYLAKWRRVRPELTGADLQAMGFAPGPRIGEVLRRLRAEQLDGRIASREQEEALVRREFPADARGEQA